MSSNLTRNVKGTINNLSHIRWALVLYDLIVFAVVAVLLLGFYGGIENLSIEGMLMQSLLCVACVEVYAFHWKYLWTSLEIWWNPVLYPSAMHRCSGILDLCHHRTDFPTCLVYHICQKIINRQFKSVRSTFYTNDVPVCI